MGRCYSLSRQYKSSIFETMMSCLHANGSLLKVVMCVLNTRRRYSLSTEAASEEPAEFLTDGPAGQLTRTPIRRSRANRLVYAMLSARSGYVIRAFPDVFSFTDPPLSVNLLKTHQIPLKKLITFQNRQSLKLLLLLLLLLLLSVYVCWVETQIGSAVRKY